MEEEIKRGKNVEKKLKMCYSHVSFFSIFFRIYLGDQLGKVETFIENLPGFPDNIRRHPDGGYLLAVPAIRKPLADFSARYPFIRKAASKVRGMSDNH